MRAYRIDHTGQPPEHTIVIAESLAAAIECWCAKYDWRDETGIAGASLDSQQALVTERIACLVLSLPQPTTETE